MVRKTETLIMKMTPQEKEQAAALAEKCGVTLSALVRQLLKDATTTPVIGYTATIAK
jgi:antitoxin component of RelBE/YafQ-DinJ toxin-antitoxin module